MTLRIDHIKGIAELATASCDIEL